jgi:hypothetical protein
MTPKQKAVIERAKNTPTRIVEHDWHQRRAGRIYRETAMVNTLAKLNRARASAILQAEQDRLVRTW